MRRRRRLVRVGRRLRVSTATSRVWNELLAGPRVHVVCERGGGAGSVQFRHAGSADDRRMLVTDVTYHVAAEVRPIWT